MFINIQDVKISNQGSNVLLNNYMVVRVPTYTNYYIIVIQV